MAMDRERPRGRKRRKVCTFCVDKVEHIDYKDAAKLRRFLSERSKILPRRTTGTCAMHQRQLTEAIKRARQIALLPFVTDKAVHHARPPDGREPPGGLFVKENHRPCRWFQKALAMPRKNIRAKRGNSKKRRRGKERNIGNGI